MISNQASICAQFTKQSAGNEVSELQQSPASTSAFDPPKLPDTVPAFEPQKRQSLPEQSLSMIEDQMQISPPVLIQASTPASPNHAKRAILPAQLQTDVSVQLSLKPECLPSTSSAVTSPSSKNGSKEESGATMSCAVCGDPGAVAKHYGVMACLDKFLIVLRVVFRWI
jgi:hypothetical protein